MCEKKYYEFDKCPVCSGVLKKQNNSLVCDSCNLVVPLSYREDIINILEQAKHDRMNNKFQDALDLYDKILYNDHTCIEANWGALLSEYGIEYVHDKSGKFKPTFHRFSYQSFYDTVYYHNIMDNTFGDDHDKYTILFDELENLRLEINTAAEDAPKYDIFLCLKISNNNSENKSKNTEEYKWAQIVYNELKIRGFKVFFSPISLPSTIGSYEVSIFTALKSAKFMVILASSRENLDSPWPKNEWGRFVRFKYEGDNEDRKKEFKLIKTSNVSIPDKLNQINAIEYTNNKDKQWLKDLIKSIYTAFKDDERFKNPDSKLSFIKIGKDIIDRTDKNQIPEIEEAQEFDINLFDFKTNDDINIKELESKSKIKHNLDLISFGKDFKPIEKNEQYCIDAIDIYLRNNNFELAFRELQNFRNETGITDIPAKMLIQFMLISVKAKNLEEFKKDKINNFIKYDLITEIINKIEAEDFNEFIKIFIDFILETITNKEANESQREKAFNFYSILSNYQNDLIYNLHCEIIKKSQFLFDYPKLLDKFIKIALPIISSNDYEYYISLATDLSNVLVKHNFFELANWIADDILIINENDATALFVKLLYEYKAPTLEKLLIAIENNSRNGLKEHFKISNLFHKISENDARLIINSIIRRINILIDTKDYSEVDEWITIIKQFNFENRDELISKIFEICLNINNSNTYDLYDSIIDAAPSKEIFIHRTLQYGDLVLRIYHDSKNAIKYFEEILKYDPYNKAAMSGILYSYVDGDFKNINKLGEYSVSDFTIIEKMIKTNDTDLETLELIEKLCKFCINYIKENGEHIKQNDNIFNVFNKLLTYFPENYDYNLLDKTEKFADELLKHRLFDKAKAYYTIILNIDETKHEAYWNLLLIKCNCINDEELKMTNYDIYQMEEYKEAIKYSKGIRDAENRYSSIIITPKKQRKKHSKIIFIIVSIVIAILIGLLLILIL